VLQNKTIAQAKWNVHWPDRVLERLHLAICCGVTGHFWPGVRLERVRKDV